jgi:toxin-antitoxin system PIN domain toxin
VKLVDVNVLLYALDTSSANHRASKEWVDAALSGSETVALSWVTLLAFIRLSTNPAVFDAPVSADEALEIVEGWLDQSCVVVVHPSDRHVAVLRDLLEPFGTAGNLTMDAHLAALAVEHGAVICSLDRDFERFPGVRTISPAT